MATRLTRLQFVDIARALLCVVKVECAQRKRIRHGHRLVRRPKGGVMVMVMVMMVVVVVVVVMVMMVVVVAVGRVRGHPGGACYLGFFCVSSH